MPHWAEALASLLKAPSWMPKPVFALEGLPPPGEWARVWGAAAAPPPAGFAATAAPVLALAMRGLADPAGVAASPGWARP